MMIVRTNPPQQFWNMLAGNSTFSSLYPIVSVIESPMRGLMKSVDLNLGVIPFSN